MLRINWTVYFECLARDYINQPMTFTNHLVFMKFRYHRLIAIYFANDGNHKTYKTID